MDKTEKILVCLFIVFGIVVLFSLGFLVSGEYYMDKFCEHLNSTHLTNGFCVDKDGKVFKVCDDVWCDIE